MSRGVCPTSGWLIVLWKRGGLNPQLERERYDRVCSVTTKDPFRLLFRQCFHTVNILSLISFIHEQQRGMASISGFWTTVLILLHSSVCAVIVIVYIMNTSNSNRIVIQVYALFVSYIINNSIDTSAFAIINEVYIMWSLKLA